MKLSDLSESDLDRLAEICNIGAGHAAGALGTLVGDIPIRLNVPKVCVVPIQDLPEVIGGSEVIVGAAHLLIEGPIQGSMLILFHEKSFRQLMGHLLKKNPDSINLKDEMTESTLAEIGNILASSFLDALSQMTKSKLLPSTPRTAFDMAGALLDCILIEIGKVQNDVLFIEVHMEADHEKFYGQLFLIPDPKTLVNLKF